MKKPVILIKLGGSAITDKTTPYKVKKSVLSRISKEISQIRGKQLIIAHGAGSFGHPTALKYGGKKGYKSKIGIAKVGFDAVRLSVIVSDCLIKQNIPAITLRPMALIQSEEGKTVNNFFKVIEDVISLDLVPVLHGDVIWDRKWKSTIFSGEKVLSEIALYLKNKGYKIEKIIQLGETDGVYDSKKRTIPRITQKNWNSIQQFIFKREGFDATGGMLHKVENALKFADFGIDTVIINNKKNNLWNAVNNKYHKGTLIGKI